MHYAGIGRMRAIHANQLRHVLLIKPECYMWYLKIYLKSYIGCIDLLR